ncbi:hypothetical protein RDV77_07095 [Porphyromonadaceae sp. NP-X]|jgi:hypothetical protein|nr:hypothetical protein [Porphyromonadaceae sp. NP-X]
MSASGMIFKTLNQFVALSATIPFPPKIYISSFDYNHFTFHVSLCKGLNPIIDGGEPIFDIVWDEAYFFTFNGNISHNNIANILLILNKCSYRENFFYLFSQHEEN